MPKIQVLPGKKPTASCLEDGLLLAIAQGSISEPALSHFLSHLEGCVWCCKRSMELEKANPGKISRSVRAIVEGPEGEDVPTRGYLVDEKGEDFENWLAIIRKMRPPHSQPLLKKESGPEQKTRFGNLEIQAVLGEGRTSVVYRALDPELNRVVALKVLRPDVAARPGMSESFLREARALASLRDPHIVILHKYSREPAPHIEMDLLQGRTLADALADGPVPPNRAMRLIGEIAHALSRLHDIGLVHRDVKPANIWLSNDQPGDRAVLLDLGLVGEGTLTAGTRGYMAPEINETTPPGPKSDVYSLGVVLRVMAMGAESGPRSRGKCPPELLPLINSMMRIDPKDRPTAREVYEIATRWQESRLANRRMVLRGLVGGGLAAVGVLTGLVTWWRLPEKKPREIIISEAAKPEGLPPDEVIPSVFSPDILTGLRHFALVDGRYIAVNSTAVCFSGAGSAKPIVCPLPDRVEYTVLREGLLAFARWNGEISIWELSGNATCKPAGTFHLDTFEDPVVSLHLASAAEGKLLIHCGKKVYQIDRSNGQFSGTPRALCEPEKFIAATGGASLARLEFAPDDSSHIIAFTQRGGMVRTRLKDMECLWGFRPYQTGPQQFAPRPDVPGAFAIGSPNGCLGVFGPDIEDNSKFAPRPVWGPEASLQGPVVQIDWLDTNRLVVREVISDKPLFVFDISGGAFHSRQLGVASALRFHVDRATSTVHCLKMNGDVFVWKLAASPV